MKYTITHNFGMMPNQLYGVTDDGQHFYFRGRGGRWQLHFGATAEDAVSGPGFEGEEERAGWFELNEWEAFFWKVIKQVENGTAQPLDWDRHRQDMKDLFIRLTTPATAEDIAKATELMEAEQDER